MIYLIVGHRGCGKTSFLRRIELYYEEQKKVGIFLDLDHEIEKHEHLSVDGIFEKYGQEYFRELEQKIFQKVLFQYKEMEEDIFISLGAGFKSKELQNHYVIWLRRSTDSQGRIFLDRPQLSETSSAFQDYMDHFSQREKYYENICDEVFTMEEGFNYPNNIERMFLNFKDSHVGGCLTLLPENFLSDSKLEYFIKKRKKWNIRFFEFRNDLLNEEHFEKLCRYVDKESILYSCRTGVLSQQETPVIDWALEHGEPPSKVSIVSLHQRSLSLEGAFEKLDKYKNTHHLKLAVSIHSFEELERGHSWWLESPEDRSFLPYSKQGRWNWYRLIHKNRMKINFFREGNGSALDQPTLHQWHRVQHSFKNGFAAVLGSPISHSQTPSEHYDFFDRYKKNVIAIDMQETEATEMNLNFLQLLGLEFAAITSPLKKVIVKYCDQFDEQTKMLGTINTLVFSQKEGWVWGFNTDASALPVLLKDLKGSSVAVWGSGGMKTSLEKSLPQAVFYSARRGEPLGKDVHSNYDTLIWTVGRYRMPDCHWPQGMEPKQVIDLNYSEDSPGREYSKQIKNCSYISGTALFKAQAEKQREIWKEFLEEWK